MFRGDVGKHEKQRVQIVEVFGKIAAPLNIVHIGEVNLCLLATDKNCIFAFVEVKTVFKIVVVNVGMGTRGGNCINGIEGCLNKVLDSGKRQAERIDRTFEAFEQVDTHKLPDASFTATARKIAGTTIRNSVLTNSEKELYLCRQKESWVITSLCPMSIQRHGRVTRINARQTAISH